MRWDREITTIGKEVDADPLVQRTNQDLGKYFATSDGANKVSDERWMPKHDQQTRDGKKNECPQGKKNQCGPNADPKHGTKRSSW